MVFSLTFDEIWEANLPKLTKKRPWDSKPRGLYEIFLFGFYHSLKKKENPKEEEKFIRF